MSYKAGEILAETQVKLVTGFSDSNVGRGTKWIWLNSGNSDHYAVLRKGIHTEAFLTVTQKERNYRTIIEILQRVKDDLTDRYDNLLDYVEDIITRLDRYRKLADTTATLRDANITGGDEVKEIWIHDALAWIKVEIYLDWTEDENVTFAE